MAQTHEVRAGFSEADLNCNYGILIATARQTTHNLQDTEDAAQEAYLSAWEHGNKFVARQPGSMLNWLKTVARNKAIDSHRRKAPPEEFIDRAKQRMSMESNLSSEEEGIIYLYVSPDKSPEDQVVENDTQRLLRKGLSKLPPAQRRVLELQYFSGLTQVEVAAALGVPLSTIKTRSRLGLGKLREDPTLIALYGSVPNSIAEPRPETNSSSQLEQQQEVSVASKRNVSAPRPSDKDNGVVYELEKKVGDTRGGITSSVLPLLSEGKTVAEICEKTGLLPQQVRAARDNARARGLLPRPTQEMTRLAKSMAETLEQRSRRRERMKNQWKDNNFRVGIKKKIQNKWKDDEYRVKLQAKYKDRRKSPHTLETRKKISETMKRKSQERRIEKQRAEAQERFAAFLERNQKSADSSFETVVFWSDFSSQERKNLLQDTWVAIQENFMNPENAPTFKAEDDERKYFSNTLIDRATKLRTLRSGEKDNAGKQGNLDSSKPIYYGRTFNVETNSIAAMEVKSNKEGR